MNRRVFLTRTAMMAVAVSFPLIPSCSDDDNGKTPDCSSTTTDILGPFYKAGAPFRESIIPPGNTKDPLILSGKVLANCDTALENAIVEIWNADDNGAYDLSEEFKFRGRCATPADGTYRFLTIIPGRYLNGSTYRPSHLHLRITAPGHRELVSQIYFKDDPFIPGDPWASAAKASTRILTVDKDTNGLDTVNFNIYLDKL